jgi:hypothetical protein
MPVGRRHPGRHVDPVRTRHQTTSERPVGLRPHVEAAFERPHVSVDVAGFSGESLHRVLQGPLDKIRAGRLTPESVAIRILLPDLSVPAVVPSRVDTGADDPRVRERAQRIAQRHTEAIIESVRELAALGLVRNATAEVRTQGTTALFKLYIINGEETFFGFYPVMVHNVTIEGESVPIFDVTGEDAALFHIAVSDDETAMSTLYVEQACVWFDSVWNTIGQQQAP